MLRGLSGVSVPGTRHLPADQGTDARLVNLVHEVQRQIAALAAESRNQHAEVCHRLKPSRDHG